MITTKHYSLATLGSPIFKLLGSSVLRLLRSFIFRLLVEGFEKAKKQAASQKFELPKIRLLKTGFSEDLGEYIKIESLCSFSRPMLDHHNVGLPERDGCDCSEKIGIPARCETTFSRFIRSGTSSKEESQVWPSRARKRKKPKPEPAGGGGGAVAHPTADRFFCEVDEGPEPNPLTTSISFDRWVLCFPRWLCRTSSSFAWRLKNSFSAEWCSIAAPSTTFPLPAPHPGCFGSIVALDFLEFGSGGSLGDDSFIALSWL